MARAAATKIWAWSGRSPCPCSTASSAVVVASVTPGLVGHRIGDAWPTSAVQDAVYPRSIRPWRPLASARTRGPARVSSMEPVKYHSGRKAAVAPGDAGQSSFATSPSQCTTIDLALRVEGDQRHPVLVVGRIYSGPLDPPAPILHRPGQKHGLARPGLWGSDAGAWQSVRGPAGRNGRSWCARILRCMTGRLFQEPVIGLDPAGRGRATSARKSVMNSCRPILDHALRSCSWVSRRRQHDRSGHGRVAAGPCRRGSSK